MEAKYEQIKELSMRLAKCSRYSYYDIHKYLTEAVMVFNVELPDPDTIDCADLGKFLISIEAQKGTLCHLINITQPWDCLHSDHNRKLTLVKASTPKEYGMMLSRKKRHK